MSTITTRDGTEIFYKDWGPKTAQPVVFHHGWPLSADDWDNQLLHFLGLGYRVIAHDRRGHGRSSQTDTGNEMDTYAADVAELGVVQVDGERTSEELERILGHHAVFVRDERGPGQEQRLVGGGDHADQHSLARIVEGWSAGDGEQSARAEHEVRSKLHPTRVVAAPRHRKIEGRALRQRHSRSTGMLRDVHANDT